MTATTDKNNNKTFYKPQLLYFRKSLQKYVPVN